MRQAEPASCVGGKRSPPLVDATADYSRTVGRLSLCRVFLTTALDLLPSTAYLNDGAGQLIQTLSPCQATAMENSASDISTRGTRSMFCTPIPRCCRVLTGLFGPAAVTRRHYAPDLAFRELVGAVAQPLLGVGDLQRVLSVSAAASSAALRDSFSWCGAVCRHCVRPPTISARGALVVLLFTTCSRWSNRL